MKKIFAILLVLTMVLTISAASFAADGKIGVAMPTQSLQRWNQDGANMKAQLEEAGYTVDLQYANNNVATQISQIENMILGGVDVLVIASIDGSALGNVLETAKEEGIPVIAYDRLIMETDAVSYYATFDNYMVGTIQGEYLVDALNLENRTADDPAYIEIFTGSPDDNNARFFFGGAMDVINPYIEEGVVVVRSDQTEFEQVATMNWDPANAQARMDNLIAAHYSAGQELDAVLCSNDSTALGVINSLQGAGFTKDNFPVITGQDCDITATKNIIAGYQSMSIFKDTRTLAAQVVDMIVDIQNGEEPEINDTETYDNGTGIIPSYLCEPVFADEDNYEELLIDSGYYTPEQLGLE
ncbi:MAG: multiple monosaccharide ABC transporter substrate-binding protein [Halanaerobiales bacterium]